MREILFRAKDIFTGKWIEGYYELGYDAETEKLTHYMWVLNHTEKYGEMFMVIPETVGQFTGLYDKNGKKIFEGDIVNEELRHNCQKNFKVYFSEERGGYFPFACGDGCGCCEDEVVTDKYCEVIGNIHDNPELLKGGCNYDK